MPESIVLFDGVCRLCNGLVRFIGNHDSGKSFRFASLQSPTGQTLLRRHHLPERALDTFYLIQGGYAYARSDAVLRVASRLPSPWPLLRVLGFLPVFIRDFLYDLVAKHRYAIFGKSEACALPDAEFLGRFID